MTTETERELNEITFDPDGTKTDEAIQKFDAEEKKETKREAGLIALDDNKGLAIKDHGQLMRYLGQLKIGGGFPKQFKTVEQAFAAWTLAASLGLVPQQAWRQIADVKGSLSLFGDLPLALVKKSGLLVEATFKEFLVDKDYKEISRENKNIDAEFIAAFCRVQKKEGEIKEYWFSVEDAKRAGLWMRKSAAGNDMPWTQYPQTMLKYRARSIALKTEFPDVLAGISIGEYDHNVTLDTRHVVDVTPEKEGTSLASKLNSMVEV